MLKLRVFLLLIAASVVAVAGYVWWLSEHRTATTLLESVERRLGDENPDFDAVLRELDLGLHFARDEGDPEIEARIRFRRAEVLFRREAWELALADCLELLDEVSADDPPTLLLAARAASRARERTQAIELARRLLEVDPENLTIRDLIGWVELALSDEALRRLHGLLDDRLPTTPTTEGMEWARLASALPEGSPRRRHAVESLLALLPGAEGDEAVRAELEIASGHVTGARESWTESLARSRSGAAVRGLQDLFTRAGRLDEAIALGQAALRTRRLSDPLPVLVDTATALHELGNPSSARRLVRTSFQRDSSLEASYKQLPQPQLLAWCTLLHDLELWPELLRAAGRLRMGRATTPQYFTGAARLGTGNRVGALQALSQVRRIWGREEAFPGEQTISHLRVAEVMRHFGRREAELSALNEAIRGPEPPRDGSPHARAWGQVHLRLGAIRRAAGNLQGANRMVLTAYRYLPERHVEIEREWREIGEAILAARRTTVEQFLTHLHRQARDLPETMQLPYRMLGLGHLHLQRGDTGWARQAARMILEEHPGFPPAQDLLAAVMRKQGRWSECADLLLELAERKGLDDDLTIRLRTLPREHFSLEQRLRWYRVDPRGAALGEVAAHLFRTGQSELALAALRPRPGESLTSLERGIAGRLFADMGQWRDSCLVLRELPADSEPASTTAGIFLLAALRGSTWPQERAVYDLAFARLRATPKLDLYGLPEAIDILLAQGNLAEARTLVSYLDRRRDGRSPEILLRLGVLDVIQRPEDAGDSLDRAEAYCDGAPAQLGRILIAADERDWETAEKEARAALRTDFPDSSHRRALLHTLAGNPVEALVAAKEADEEYLGLEPARRLSRLLCEYLAADFEAPTSDEGEIPEESPGGDEATPGKYDEQLQAFLATFGGALDHRRVVAILLALEQEAWPAWVVARLRELPDSITGRPWPTYLEAQALALLGATDEADTLLRRLTRSEERFPFSWELRAQLALESGVDPFAPEMIQLRMGRVRSFGPTGLNEQEAPLYLSAALLQSGKGAEAVTLLETAVHHQGDDPALAIALARTRAQTQDDLGAIAEFETLLREQPEITIHPIVPEYLQLLRDSEARDTISAQARRARLEALEAILPLEPSIPLEIARHSAARSGSDFRGGVRQALARLARFRERIAETTTVTELREDQGAAWSAFLLEHDPDLAFEFSRTELLANPATLGLWEAHAAAVSAVGRRTEALELILDAQEILPDPAVQLRGAHLLVGLGRNPQTEMDPRTLFQAAKELGVRSELELLIATARLNGDLGQLSSGISVLQRLWDRPPPGEATARELGGDALAQALVWRSNPGDRARAAEILDTLLEEETEPVRRSYYRALAHLARHQ